MGRSNGYRPKAANRAEGAELRAMLAECRDDEWIKAGMIMDRITAVLGVRYGPMNGRIEPRACKYCHHYGHTRQWCKARLADVAQREEREIAALIKEDREREARYANVQRELYDPRKTAQAQTYDTLGIPYTIRPDIGPILGVRGAEHHGKWTFDATGAIIKNGFEML